MQQSLRSIAEAVNELLKQDPYPDQITPAFLRDAVRDYPARGGKRLRPALLTWCGALLGAEPEKLLLPAAAVEVFHNWTLVHDDIIDQDPLRRGQPTTHVMLAGAIRQAYPAAEAERFGRDFAILCGDLQQSWANDLLARAPFPPAVTVAALRRMQQLGGVALISGEAVDVELSLRDPLTVAEEEVFAMTRGKTGALLRLSAELGAMFALDSADPADPAIRKLGDFAEDCGVAFQLRDDYLGIFGGESLGKPLGNDLREGKPTVLLLRALSLSDASARRELAALLHSPEPMEELLPRAKVLLTDCGAKASLEREMQQLIQRALTQLDTFPDTCYRDYLAEFASLLIVREL